MQINWNQNYEVSPLGEVWRMGAEKNLTPTIGPDGKPRITMFKGSKKKTVLLARLVAEHFVDNPNGYFYVVHKDGNLLNCKSDNLEWVDRTPALKQVKAKRPVSENHMTDEMALRIAELKKQGVSFKDICAEMKTQTRYVRIVYRGKILSYLTGIKE